MSRRRSAALLLLVFAGGCVHRFTSLDVQPLEAGAAPVTVSTPVRAHLVDGSVVVYRSGVSVDADSLRGPGTRYEPLMTGSQQVQRVAMDSVVGMEAISVEQHMGRTVLVSAASTVVAGFGVLLGAVAISCIADPKCFGSCPTVYTMAADGEVLEAELFSYSVAPLLEARDVDRLGTQVDADGIVELELRNEALETHRINYLGMIAVEHEPDELVMPDARGRPVALRGLQVPTRAVDASGRDVRAVLAARDSSFYASPAAMLASASVDELEDHIDLTLPPMPGHDSIAVVLRLRNSLLNTVLFYDLMLASAGAQALDWMGESLQRIGPAVELGRWYAGRMGLWVSAGDATGRTMVERVPDAGPIAWKDVAVVVPVTGDDSVRVRLGFVVDEWRIDQVRIATGVRRPDVREVPVSEIVRSDGATSDAARASLAAPDEDYLETLPSNVFRARFDVGPSAAPRTFLIAAQGYYTEWIRPAWIRGARDPQPFVASDASLVEAIRRWEVAKPDFERRFYETRIPVR